MRVIFKTFKNYLKLKKIHMMFSKKKYSRNHMLTPAKFVVTKEI